MDDLAIVERQLRRAPRGVRRVAARCPYGAPAVVEQDGYLDDGAPFPTTYYLTCPSAVAAVGALEDAGGVGRYERLVAAGGDAAASYAWGAARQRQLRRPAATMADGGASLTLGIGGTAHDGAVKCLHAHAAFALAEPDYALGAAILDEAWPLYPAGGCCSA
ncbi:MAG TPA: DUF501 domain-containing protein [Gaiellales bacterium]|nr:DUF501 domain-containing protein [Gaiellales bacterium]